LVGALRGAARTPSTLTHHLGRTLSLAALNVRGQKVFLCSQIIWHTGQKFTKQYSIKFLLFVEFHS
jgi:hypothetical protein